jgi:hypothetical protein
MDMTPFLFGGQANLLAVVAFEARMKNHGDFLFFFDCVIFL